MPGTSTWVGKEQIKQYLLPTLHPNDKICDMGAGGGMYYGLLGKEYDWTAVEIWHDSVLELKKMYNHVYEADIRNFEYPEYYDLIIFGDVIEHLTAEDAIVCVKKAKENGKAIMIAVPYCFPQDAIYGNEAERHLQVDLTPEIFDERYPGFERVFEHSGYAYYYWHKDDVDTSSM